MRSQHPPRNGEIRRVVKDAILKGDYRFSAHTHERMHERGIIERYILDVLEKGRREPAKDVYDERFSRWKYSWRGRNKDGRDLRIIVAEISPGILIITAIGMEDED